MSLAAIAILSSPSAFAADSSPQEQSQYNLFNPVPDDQLRSLSTDRPTKSSSPYTVDAGHFAYEADIANWTYDRNNTSHVTTSNVIVGDPVLKAGLTNSTDLEVALAPLNIDQTHNRTTGVGTTYYGFGDLYARMKFNIFGNDGGDYALAIVPYVKAPTANQHIGNSHWEGGGYIPFVVLLPDDWVMGITSEYDQLENTTLNGMHSNFSNMINFGHPLFDPRLTGYVEFWSDVNNDVGAQTQYTADFALAWLVKDTLQLDCGVNVGLNKAADDLQPYLGISQAF